MNELKDNTTLSAERIVHVLIVGAGAVGSIVVDRLIQMFKNIMVLFALTVIDMDRLEAKNLNKSSYLYRLEDVGRFKAEALAERAQPCLPDGCTVNGIVANLDRIGPEALDGYDYVVLAVDNFNAKALCNELICLLPKEKRPIVVMAGTSRESAQTHMMDFTEYCLRCMINEDWLFGGEGGKRHSCVGPQYRSEGNVLKEVTTTGNASAIAASLTVEKIRAHLAGYTEPMNSIVAYHAYPDPKLVSFLPRRKNECPGCAVTPPGKIEWLSGSSLSMTLGQGLEQIGAVLGTSNFELSVHRLRIGYSSFGGFIQSDSCHRCGKPIKVIRHEGRTFERDLLCHDCRPFGAAPDYVDKGFSTVLNVFTPSDTPGELLNMTLYELGYPLGAYLKVIERYKEGTMRKVRTTYFALSQDHDMMFHGMELE